MSPLRLPCSATVRSSSGATVIAGGRTNILRQPNTPADPAVGCEGDHAANINNMLWHEVDSTFTTFKNARGGIRLYVRLIRGVSSGMGSLLERQVSVDAIALRQLAQSFVEPTGGNMLRVEMAVKSDHSYVLTLMSWQPWQPRHPSSRPLRAFDIYVDGGLVQVHSSVLGGVRTLR